MAENQEDRSTEDLSEQESPYRLEEYREKGMVAQSRELNGLVALVATSVTFYMMAPTMGSQLMDLMREFFNVGKAAQMNFSTAAPSEALFKVLKAIAIIGLPVCIAGFIIAIASSYAQIGSIFSFEPLTPDLTKLNPIEGIKKLASLKHILESLLTVGKVTVVLTVVYFTLKTQVLESPSLLQEEPGTQFALMGRTWRLLFWPLVMVMGVFAALDFWVNKHEYSKKLRLTKQEAKQEHKEREGDPQIKARIRSVQREMARRRMMAAVKKADVVVTNPTHIAVALSYDKEKMAAPKVVAKGADFIAQKIKQIAADAGVPLVENVPLARAMFKSVKVGQTVPRQLYQAVAEVLAHVYRLKNRSKI